MILGICGSPRKKATEYVLREALMQLKKKENELDEYQKEDLKARLTHYGL